MNDQAMDGQTAAELDRAGLLHVDDGVRIVSIRKSCDEGS